MTPDRIAALVTIAAVVVGVLAFLYKLDARDEAWMVEDVKWNETQIAQMHDILDRQLAIEASIASTDRAVLDIAASLSELAAIARNERGNTQALISRLEADHKRLIEILARHQGQHHE